MAERWITSDMHFGHKNIIKFTTPDGGPIRPGYFNDDNTFVSFEGDIDFHDECYIDRYNTRVKDRDKVYILGDVGRLDCVRKLNGNKHLILGNHDDHHKLSDLDKIFRKVTSWKVWGKDHEIPFVMCHYPLHANESFPVNRRICVHGHIHEKEIRLSSGEIDPWYVNVCVEHTNHRPIHWDELMQILRQRKEEIDNP